MHARCRPGGMRKRARILSAEPVACACIRSGARHAPPLARYTHVLYRLTVGNRREAEESLLERVVWLWLSYIINLSLSSSPDFASSSSSSQSFPVYPCPTSGGSGVAGSFRASERIDADATTFHEPFAMLEIVRTRGCPRERVCPTIFTDTDELDAP